MTLISKEEIRKRVKAIVLSKLLVDEDELTPDTNFTNDLGANSLDMVELVMEYEKEFGISIPNSDAECFETLQDVYDYLESIY